MASSSPSFLLTTTPHSKLQLKPPKQLNVFARSNSSSSSEDIPAEKAANFNLFKIKWGNLSDVKSLIPVMSNPPAVVGSARSKDAGTVYVAGAAGQAGARIVLRLLREGFRVRAGVTDLADAQQLARFVSDYKIISTEELKRLNAVESSTDDPESIAKAIGNASKVVVTIGPTENGPTNRFTTLDALQVVEAAQLAGVNHGVIIYDETPSTGSTNNTVLDGISTFFNNLFAKSQPLSVTQFLETVIQTDVKYTFIKTALTDDFSKESSYNVIVAAEGSIGDTATKVPRSQIAAMVAGLFSDIEVAEDKVVEVFTDSEAPVKSLKELFSIIPEDGRRKAYKETLAKAKAEEEAMKAAAQAQEAEEAKKRLEEEVKKLSEQEALAATLAEEAKQKAKEAGISVDNLLNKAKDIGSGFSWETFQTQLANSVNNIEVPKVQIATVRGQTKARNLTPQKAVVKSPKQTPKPKPKPKTSPAVSKEMEKPKDETKQVKNILGGLFKQETIYVDD